jgi:hypothetical protein
MISSNPYEFFLFFKAIEKYLEHAQLSPLKFRFANVECLRGTIRFIRQLFEFWLRMWQFSSPVVRASFENLRQYFIGALRSNVDPRGGSFGKSLQTIAIDLGKLEAVYRGFDGLAPFQYGKFGTVACYALQAAA